MLTGSLGQVPAFSIPVSPHAKHGTGDHPEPPNNLWDCCRGMKAARGVRGGMGMEAAGGKGSTPPGIALSPGLPARTRPPLCSPFCSGDPFALPRLPRPGRTEAANSLRGVMWFNL